MGVFAPGGSAPATGSSQLPKSTPTLINLSMPTQGTEYSFTIPAGACAIRIRPRHATELRLAYAPGATSTLFETVRSGCTWFEDQLILPSSLTIYVQSPNKGNLVLEVNYWS